MSIFFGLLFARRFYCCPALSLSPGRTGGLFPRINAPNRKKPHKSVAFLYCYIIMYGAGDRGRTGTVSLPPDFESGTSANSITPAHNAVYYTVMLQENQVLLNNL